MFSEEMQKYIVYEGNRRIAVIKLLSDPEHFTFLDRTSIERAKRIIPNCQTYLLQERGHMHFLTDDEKKMIVDFLKLLFI